MSEQRDDDDDFWGSKAEREKIMDKELLDDKIKFEMSQLG